VLPGATVTVVIAGGPGNRADWATLSSTSAPDTTYLAWKYLSDTHSYPLVGLSAATITFTAPTTDGTYNVKLFANDSWSKLATSNTITVAAATPTLSVPSTVVAGSTFSVGLSGGPGNLNDWIALTPSAGADSSYVAWKYLSNTHSYPTTHITDTTLTYTA